MKEELESALRPLLGDKATVENVHVLTGGASRTTYAFEAVTATVRRRLILRTGPASEHYAGMELEAAAQSAASAAGAPVPEVLTASDSTVPLGDPYLICAEIPGETIVRRIQRVLDDDGRRQLLRQCAHALAAIHRARPDIPGLTAQDQLADYRRHLDEIGDTTATFEWAFRWLADNRPRQSPPVLAHGDFRMGNLIVDGLDPSAAPTGPVLAAVLDWELVHIGEAYEDLAWFCIRAWRFGAPADLAAGGLGGVEEFVRAYEQAGGAPVDRAALRWWLVLATLRWGVICRMQAERHLSGEHPSVELAAIGRRVCETEWDILDLLGVEPAPPPHGTAQPAGRPSGLHGRPTAAELIAAVVDFLDGEVRAGTAGAVNFHALVAANALRIVERELRDTTAADACDALANLGYPDEASFAGDIRSGRVDSNAPEVTGTLRTIVGHRLAVSHPGYSAG